MCTKIVKNWLIFDWDIQKEKVNVFIATYACIIIYASYQRDGRPVVSVLDSGVEGPGFKSQSRRLGKLFTPIVPLFTKQQNW